MRGKERLGEIKGIGHMVGPLVRSLRCTCAKLQNTAGIRKAVRHARMAHKATKWPIKKILTGPVMRPDRTKLVK